MGIQERDPYDILESIFSTPLDLMVVPTGFSVNDNSIRCKRLYECGAFIIILAEFDADSIYPYHCHDNSSEHFVCISGKLEVKVGDEVKILEPTECMTIAIGVLHLVRALEKSVVVAICIPPEIAYCKPIG